MKITFYGGISQVTGSNFLCETQNKKILIECGMIQGTSDIEMHNAIAFAYDPKSIDALLITHAHLDHIGRIPKLIKDGFAGPIYSTLPTKQLAQEILADTVRLMERDTDNTALYDKTHVEKTCALWETISYHEPFSIGGATIEYFDAGHILGSAFIKVEENGISVVFSGDLGNSPNVLLRDLEALPDVHYLVTESTYGNRNHDRSRSRRNLLEDIIEDTIAQKKTLLIPAFAVERTQEIMFDIQDLIEQSKVPLVPLFLDSPLANRVTDIYEQHTDYFNAHAKDNLLYKHVFSCPNMHHVYSMEDEKKLFDTAEPKIIIAGSGMITGGRIMNILKKIGSDPKTTLLFVGYQSPETPGRKIMDGAKEIMLDDELIKIAGNVEQILSYSGHIDQQELLDWITPRKSSLKNIFIVHGDTDAKIALHTKITEDLKTPAIIPEENQAVEL